MSLNTAVLGASAKPERYSYKAVKLLEECGHKALPVHPSARPIDGTRCYPSLDAIEEKIDTITVYLGEKNSTPLIDDILRARPRRVILNPGAENAELKRRLEGAGIQVVEACTLVLLRTGRY